MIGITTLITAIKREYEKNGINYKEDDVFELLSKIIATVELIPYHSVKMTSDMQNKLKNFKSVEYTREL